MQTFVDNQRSVMNRLLRMCAKFKVEIYSAELETWVEAGNWGRLNIYIPVIQHVGSEV